MYVRKDDNKRVFWKGLIRAGEVVPDALALAHPDAFEWVVGDGAENEPDASMPDVDTAWEMTEADLEDDGEDFEEEISGEPFEGYDDMSVPRIAGELRRMELSDTQLMVVRNYEVANKDRSTLLREIDELLEEE